MKKSIFILILPLLFSCASSYKPLRPSTHHYPASRDYSGLEFSYKMGVLQERRNKKYAKREDMKAIRLVAVKLVNNTASALTVGKHFNFYSGGSPLVLLEPPLVHAELKQGVPIYLLYLLLSPMQLYTSDEMGNVESTPIGLIVGPGIAIGNMAGAGAANQNFLRELVQYNMIGKTIEPGETVYGLIGIGDNAYNAIEIRFAGSASSN